MLNRFFCKKITEASTASFRWWNTRFRGWTIATPSSRSPSWSTDAPVGSSHCEHKIQNYIEQNHHTNNVKKGVEQVLFTGRTFGQWANHDFSKCADTDGPNRLRIIRLTTRSYNFIKMLWPKKIGHWPKRYWPQTWCSYLYLIFGLPQVFNKIILTSPM